MGFDVRLVRIRQADGFHRAIAQRLAATFGHDLNRKTAFEIRRVFFPILEFGFVTSEQGIDEGIVLIFIHGAVDIGRCVAMRSRLVIAGLAPRFRHVDAVELHDRGNGVKKGQILFAGQLANRMGKRLRGEGTRRNDDR